LLEEFECKFRASVLAKCFINR